MSYTNNERRKAQAMRRKRRLRKKRIRRIKTILFSCLCLLILMSIYLLFFVKAHKVEDYGAYYYKNSVQKGELYSTNLCVSADNINLAGAPSSKDLMADALFCVDDATALHAYQVHERLYPASLTKLMTALVAFEKGNLDDVVTVSANADCNNFAYDEKTCGIHEGDQITLRDLLYGLLLYSGNDNAVAIAEHLAGTQENFSAFMNDEAKKIMATNSHFVNPNGLHDENHYTTAYDLYLIFNECMKYEDFITMINASSYEPKYKDKTGKEIKDVLWEPTNLYATGDVLRPDNAAIIGGKTGTTLKAGNCLILLTKDYKTSKKYVSIVMGANTKETLYKKMTALIKDIPSEEEKEDKEE